MPRHVFSVNFTATSPGLFRSGEDLELAFGTEPILAWRVWQAVPLSRHGGVRELRLTSIGIGDVVWPPRRRLEALCYPGSFAARQAYHRAFGNVDALTAGVHESPWTSCSCGVWGLRSEAEVREIAGQRHVPRTGRQPYVFGRVALWGRIVEHEQGWRAQYAYPHELITYDSATVDALARTYEVPVRVEEAPPSPPQPDEIDITPLGGIPKFSWSVQPPTFPALPLPPPHQLATLPVMGTRRAGVPGLREPPSPTIVDGFWLFQILGWAIYVPSVYFLRGDVKTAGVVIATLLFTASLVTIALRLRSRG